MEIFLLVILLPLIFAYENPSTCSGFYNYLTHSCTACPTNTSPANNIGFCNCSSNYYQNPAIIGFNNADSCLDLGSAPSANQIIVLYDPDGTLNPGLTTCIDSYANADNSACIPCGHGMQYNQTNKKCECKNANEYIIGEACYTTSLTFTNPFSSNQASYEAYNKAVVGCYEKNDNDSCQILLNYCSISDYDPANAFCELLLTNISNYGSYNSLPTPLTQTAPTDSLQIYASSITGANTTTIKNKLDFYMIQYNRNGEVLDIKPLSDQIFPSTISEDDLIQFQSFGKNLLKQSSNQTTVNEYSFDIFVLDVNRSFVQVPLTFQGYPEPTSYFKRLSYTSTYNSIKAQYYSEPPLRVPYISMFNNNTRQIETTSTAPVTIQSLVPFIIFNIFILIAFVFNFYKYLKYNPNMSNDPNFFFKSLLLFFLMALKYWGIGLWMFLFSLSTYIFCFFKFQQTVFLLLPNVNDFGQWQKYYHHFMAVFYTQFGFLLFAVFLLIYDLGKTTDYFMIDWEKQKSVGYFDIGNQKRQASVWRKVLLVNELYELTIHRLINVEFVALLALLFLEGLQWINLEYQVPNTQNLLDHQSSTKNPVLAHFIITFVVFTIAAIQYLLKYMFKVWFPLPHQNFVDLCSISNISLVIFDQFLHGYYIHGINPLGQAEGNLKYIESIFQKQAKSFGKSRAFRNDDPDSTQVFEVVFPFEIRQAFEVKYKMKYLQKLGNIDTTILSNAIPEMLSEDDYSDIQLIQSDMIQSFKYYLEGVKTSQFNVKEKSFIQKIINCPIDVEIIGKLPIFFKDYWSEFTNVLMCGHEFIFLMNTINLIIIWFIVTKSIFMGVFITMCISRIILKNLADVSVRKNISKNTLIDDKFFN